MYVSALLALKSQNDVEKKELKVIGEFRIERTDEKSEITQVLKTLSPFSS